MPRAPLEILEFRADQVSDYPDAVLRVARGEFCAIVIRGVYPRAAMERVVERLGRGEFAIEPRLRESTNPDTIQSLAYGLPVSPSDLFPDGPDPQEYMDTVPEFNAACSEIFAPNVPVTERVHEILSALSGGLPTGPATGPEGQPYCAATIRQFAPSLGLGPHCENEFTGTLPVFAAIRDDVAVEDQMPYYVQAASADEGGDLVLYEAFWTSDGEPPHKGVEGDRDHTSIIADLPHRIVELQPGDMVLFDGASRYHQVNEVRGSRSRWTIGGFATLSRDGARLAYWA